MSYNYIDDEATEIPEVTEEHPEVQRAVTSAVEAAQSSPLEITQEMYTEALQAGIDQAYQKRNQGSEVPRY